MQTRMISSYRVCIDYKKFNLAMKKDNYPLPFIDQILERLGGHKFYYFLDGYLGYNQIAVHEYDLEKTTFTCLVGSFSFKRMPFGLCSASATFQQCMNALFSNFIGEYFEIFMDDFSVSSISFDKCLTNLEQVLKICVDINLVQSWEKPILWCNRGFAWATLSTKTESRWTKPRWRSSCCPCSKTT